MGIKIKLVKTNNEAVLPQYAKPGDAGLDLYSVEDAVLKPGERRGVATGIKMEIPDGYVGLVWDKSGVALNSGIKTMGGVVDSGYRGEVKVIMINLSNNDFEIKKYSKVAQMIIKKFEQVEIEEASELSESERGDRGFGSTGLV